MKYAVLTSLLVLILASPATMAADPPGEVPVASAAFRAEYIRENAPACIKGIEDNLDLRALYSHKTVEVYCNCRQRFRADVVAQAIKENKRGKLVSDQAADYAKKQCVHILLQHIEKD